MKTAISIFILILGIFLFRFGHSLLDHIKKDKDNIINTEEFWNSDIFISDSKQNLNFTPAFFFRTIPSLNIYPENKIIYFKEQGSRFQGNKVLITSIIIQNNTALYRNIYYFSIDQNVELFKIISENLISDSSKKIKDTNELRSIMKTYKGFIDLWLLYDKEK